MSGRHVVPRPVVTAPGQGGETHLIRHTVEDLDDTFIGLRVLITGPNPNGGTHAICGGISDLIVSDTGTIAALWIAGRLVIVTEPAQIITEAPRGAV
jgi:hypothetical protein